VAAQDYLARYRAADLFLDTFPYNAGTTASDALWMGVPVLTCTGQSFASRMAASLLHSLGLPDLVTDSRPSYEARAVELAQIPDKLAEVRARLLASRNTSPLFDGEHFARDLERAYAQMHARAQAKLPPEHIELLP
jgi:protein O-GlcNAc transferase